MKITLSIVSHAQASLVQRLLISLDRYLIAHKCNIQIVIIENTNLLWKPISDKFEINFIQNLRRQGFGANHNKIFEHAPADYFFIINPDIILCTEMFIDEIIHWLEENDVSISSPIIVCDKGVVQDFRRYDLKLFDIIFRRTRGANNQDFDWIAGMFMITSSASFKALGGFDHSFFMYVEDCDLCMRARKVNMKLQIYDKISVIHTAQRQSRKSIRLFIVHVISILKYFYKR